jgi:hypothetical protein
VAWTVEQVLGLAPDTSLARAGRELASARKWLTAGSQAEAVWGECQGSARHPYRTTVDLAGPAFKCSCPSRKFPCKHALGLLLLYAADNSSTPQGEPPGWASEWLQGRRAVEGKQAATAKEPADPQRAAFNQQQRARRREERISNGIADLERWLHDLVRAGLAEAAARPWTSYEQMSARLVDAQAPGLARLVRELGSLPHTASNWPERMLIDLGQVSLLLDAWRRLDSLPAGLQADVRSLVGINESREAVLATPAVHDVWDVVGRRILDGERMRVQRTWLWGQRTQRCALLLDFSVGGQAIEQSVTPGASFEAGLCFYPGASPLRALLQSPPVRVGSVTHLPSRSIDDALRMYARWLGGNPWLERLPIAIKDVLPLRAHDETWWLADEHSQRLRITGPLGWHLLALSGGQPIDVFGEWDGFSFWPLAAGAEGKLAPLPMPVAA